jgi:hypothetical protein
VKALREATKKLDRMISVGDCSYVRLYPNPGIGLRLSPKLRVTLSWWRGFEVFRAIGDPCGPQKRRAWKLVLRRGNRKLGRI